MKNSTLIYSMSDSLENHKKKIALFVYLRLGIWIIDFDIYFALFFSSKNNQLQITLFINRNPKDFFNKLILQDNKITHNLIRIKNFLDLIINRIVVTKKDNW